MKTVKSENTAPFKAQIVDKFSVFHSPSSERACTRVCAHTNTHTHTCTHTHALTHTTYTHTTHTHTQSQTLHTHTHTNHTQTRTHTEYRLIAKKGEGTFSEVLKAQCVKNGKMTAIKCMKSQFESEEQVNNLREIQVGVRERGFKLAYTHTHTYTHAYLHACSCMHTDTQQKRTDKHVCVHA